MLFCVLGILYVLGILDALRVLWMLILGYGTFGKGQGFALQGCD
jgi:hypothetical protein